MWYCRILLVAWVGGLLSMPCSAEEPDARSGSFERIFESKSTQDAHALWQRLLDSDFRLSSTGEESRGYFESAVAVKDQTGQLQSLYWQLDDNGTRRLRYTPGTEPEPGMVFIDDQEFILEASQQWERRSVKHWSHLLDSNHFSDFAIVPSSGNRSLIEVDLRSYLNGAKTSSVARSIWDAATLTLKVDKSNGSEWFIRFRTPTDQRRFGTLLSELDLRASQGKGYIVHRCFIVDQASPLRINVASADELSTVLKARQGDDVSPMPKILQISGIEDRRAAHPLSQHLNRLKCEESRSPEFADSRSRFQEMIYGYQTAYQSEVAPAIRANLVVNNTAEFVSWLVEELEIAQLSIESAIAPDGTPVDDPCLRWLGLERVLTPRMAGLLYGDLCAGILNWDRAPLESRVALGIAISEFGPPIWAVSSPGLEGTESVFLGAIMHARWGWLPTELELSECVNVLAYGASSKVLKLAAVDSLVRWGRFDLVPEETLDIWLSSRCSSSEATRRSTFKCLSRSVKGRVLLCERLRNGRVLPSVAGEAVALLRAYAGSTLELQRFDFMSEDECRTALEVCDKIDRR